MAEFAIEQLEGMRWVKITLADDSARGERGSLSYMTGNVSMEVPLPSLRAAWISLFSQESLVRPRFTGTGVVYLEASMGGFHVFDVQEGEKWIVESGAYWASDKTIDISVVRERMMTAYWSQEGLIWYQTCVRGTGKVVLVSEGPVEEATLNNERMIVDGRIVLARTDGIRFSVRRPTKSYFQYLLSGEKWARVYEGTGKLLICHTPYWRLKMSQRNAPADVALME